MGGGAVRASELHINLFVGRRTRSVIEPQALSAVACRRIQRRTLTRDR
jgi:hypothetical protein